MIKAVILDMDGVLIDSEPFWREAEIEAFGEVGLRLTDDLCRETMGLRIDEAVDYWHRKHGWEGRTPGEVAERVVRGLIERIRREGELMAGARHALEFFKARGVKLGLASSSSYRIIGTVVERLGLAGEFGCVYSAEEEEYGKPHPGIYLTAARRLGVSPTECLAIEDSLNGVLAAKAARMRCAAVPEAEARRDPRFAIAEVTLDSLEEIGEGVWRRVNQ